MTKPYYEMGKRIKEVREYHRIDPTEMAKRLGIEVPTFRMYERGDRKIPINVAKRFSNEFHTTPEYIYYGTETRKLANDLYSAYSKAPEYIQKTIKKLLGLDE